jgi:hypothetical protein
MQLRQEYVVGSNGTVLLYPSEPNGACDRLRDRRILPERPLATVAGARAETYGGKSTAHQTTTFNRNERASLSPRPIRRSRRATLVALDVGSLRGRPIERVARGS